jgi:hypothetical protein
MMNWSKVSSPKSQFAKALWTLDLGLRLVDLARFERATSTFAESRSPSAELQVQSIAEC